MITKQEFDYNPNKSFTDTVKEKYPDFNPEDYEFLYFTDGFMLKERTNTKATKAKTIAEEITDRIIKNKTYFTLDIDWKSLHSSGFTSPPMSEFIDFIEEATDKFDLMIEIIESGRDGYTISIVAFDNVASTWNDKQICKIDIIKLTNTIFTDEDLVAEYNTPFGEKTKRFPITSVKADVAWLV